MPKQSRRKVESAGSKAEASDLRENGRISPCEWDFRLVREAELPTAILYEYTRSCPRVCSAIKKWHARKFNFKQFAELDCQSETESILSVLRMLERVTNADAVEIAYSPLLPLFSMFDTVNIRCRRPFKAAVLDLLKERGNVYRGDVDAPFNWFLRVSPKPRK